MGHAAAPDQPLLRTCPARRVESCFDRDGQIALRGLRCGTSAAKKEITMATEVAHKDHAHSEGQVAKAIEEQTAKLPSDAFLWMAVG